MNGFEALLSEGRLLETELREATHAVKSASGITAPLHRFLEAKRRLLAYRDKYGELLLSIAERQARVIDDLAGPSWQVGIPTTVAYRKLQECRIDIAELIHKAREGK